MASVEVMVASGVLSRCEQIASQAGSTLYCVGGVVRDLLCGDEAEHCLNQDVDLVIEGESEAFLDLCQQDGLEVKRYPNYLTAKISGFDAGHGVAHGAESADLVIDIACCREESYPFHGGLPSVKKASTIAEDSNRRDFSLNALYLPLEALIEVGRMTAQGSSVSVLKEFVRERVRDPQGGLEDASLRLLRILHQQSFLDDPTRILRGARYCAAIRGSYDNSTVAALTSALPQIGWWSVEGQRFGGEWRRIVSHPQGVQAFQHLLSFGVLQRWRIVPFSRAEAVDACLRKLLKEAASDRSEEQVSVGEQAEFIMWLARKSVVSELDTQGAEEEAAKLHAALQVGKRRLKRWRAATEMCAGNSCEHDNSEEGHPLAGAYSLWNQLK